MLQIPKDPYLKLLPFHSCLISWFDSQIFFSFTYQNLQSSLVFLSFLILLHGLLSIFISESNFFPFFHFGSETGSLLWKVCSHTDRSNVCALFIEKNDYIENLPLWAYKCLLNPLTDLHKWKVFLVPFQCTDKTRIKFPVVTNDGYISTLMGDSVSHSCYSMSVPFMLLKLFKY